MEIKAGTEEAKRVLTAATEGSINVLERESDDVLKEARCNSGENRRCALMKMPVPK